MYCEREAVMNMETPPSSLQEQPPRQAWWQKLRMTFTLWGILLLLEREKQALRSKNKQYADACFFSFGGIQVEGRYRVLL